jgi:DNA polymerase III subunit delta'
MQFKDIIGQQALKQHLLNAVQSGHLSHALLFTGPTGCGKLPMALALAQYLNCTDRKADDSCGECPACKKNAKLIHPDLHFVFPILKIKNRETTYCDDYIRQWREMVLTSPYFKANQWFEKIDADKGQGMIYTSESDQIIRKLSLKAFEGEYKVMIIWHAEKMHLSCANALLKIIEEPPHKTVFLLITDQPANILGTILSRTQQLKFHRLTDEEVTNSLVTREQITESQANAIAKLAVGDYIQAVELANESEELKFFFEQFVSLMRFAYGRKLMDILSWVEEMVDQPKERQRRFLIYALRMIRENYIMNLKQPSIVYMLPNEAAFAEKFSPYVNDHNAFQIAEELSLAHAHLEQNGNAKIIFTDFALKLIILLKE